MPAEDHRDRGGAGAEAHRGAQVTFVGGEVVVSAAAPAAEGWVPAMASIVSPGTEMRALRATRHGPACPAGYMTIGGMPEPGGGQGPAGLLLAPVPHGASFRPDHPRAVSLRGDAVGSEGLLAVAAAGRFQLMAALGLDRLGAESPLDDTVVVGSGPVAVGCALELRRRGAAHIRVVTARNRPPIADIPGVTLLSVTDSPAAHLIVDCAGRPDIACEMAAAGGTVGLLGTPDDALALSALALHRRGLHVVGMHELVRYEHARYQRAFDSVTRWLARESGDVPVHDWVGCVPGAQAASLYADLAAGRRPAAVFLILDWRA